MLTKRQIDILISLSNTKEPVTAEWVAKELGVSDRTVRNEIRVIISECPNLGVSIESFRGKGYLFQVVNPSLFSTTFKRLTRVSRAEITNDFSDHNDRVIYMLKKLLLEKEPIKFDSFEDNMFISKSTIQNVLKIVRQILSNYNLKIITRPHYGTMVEGDEYMKRLCLSNHIINRPSEMITSELLDQELIKKLKEIIIKKINEFKIEISDTSLENLAIHIAIACNRIEEDCIIEPFTDTFISNHPFEKTIAIQIVEKVQAFTGLIFPESEIDYIIVHLLGTKLINKEELMEISEYDETRTIVQCMLERLKSELNWDFHNDIEFIQALTLHIRPVMNRLRYKMNIRNSMLNKIKAKYTSAFEGAVIASKCIEEYLFIEPDEHEIAYIALHIEVALERLKSKRKKVKRVIVVCASGVGIAKLLYYRLQNLFKNDLEIVASISYYKLPEFDLSSIDFIISTIPIKEDLGIPIQVVNNLLSEEDTNQIKNYIYPVSVEGITHYLDQSKVFLQQNLKDKESVIRFLCHELYKQGLVQEDYVNLVLKREALAPTNFGNLVAIPHPLTPTTEETFWTVCTLKSPIPWHGNQMVQMVCLLNIQKGPKGDLDQMYRKLLKVVENKTIVQKIIKSQNINEVIKILY